MAKCNVDAMPAIRLAIDDVMNSGRFIGGDVVRHFENRFSSYIGTKYSVGVNSGSDALKLALLALGIKPGDKIAVPSFTFVSTVDAVLHVGAIPIFVDINHTYSIDQDDLEVVLKAHRIKAVIVVHLYGIPAAKEVIDIARKYGALVIEDTAQAHGARIGRDKCGSLGDASCFSFYPSKNLGAFGDGGMVCTNDDNVAQNIRGLREYGQIAKYVHTRLGMNSRLDAIQAAVLDAKLDHLDKWNQDRFWLARRYDELLETWNVTTIAGSDAVYHIYPYQSDNRDKLMKTLQGYGIECLVHYPIPVHMQSYYTDFRRRKLPVTEYVAATELSLPLYPYMNDTDIEDVVEAIKVAEK